MSRRLHKTNLKIGGSFRLAIVSIPEGNVVLNRTSLLEIRAYPVIASRGGYRRIRRGNGHGGGDGGVGAAWQQHGTPTQLAQARRPENPPAAAGGRHSRDRDGTWLWYRGRLSD